MLIRGNALDPAVRSLRFLLQRMQIQGYQFQLSNLSDTGKILLDPNLKVASQPIEMISEPNDGGASGPNVLGFSQIMSILLEKHSDELEDLLPLTSDTLIDYFRWQELYLSTPVRALLQALLTEKDPAASAQLVGKIMHSSSKQWTRFLRQSFSTLE